MYCKKQYNIIGNTNMNNLRYHRLKSGVTVEELAHKIRCSQKTIYSLEEGHRNAMHFLPALAAALGVPKSILVKRVKRIQVQSRLYELRQRAKKTLEEVQLKTNLTKQYLSLIERGRCIPSPRVQNALADYFSSVLKKNITPQKLFPVIYE